MPQLSSLMIVIYEHLITLMCWWWNISHNLRIVQHIVSTIYSVRRPRKAAHVYSVKKVTILMFWWVWPSGALQLAERAGFKQKRFTIRKCHTNNANTNYASYRLWKTKKKSNLPLSSMTNHGSRLFPTTNHWSLSFVPTAHFLVHFKISSILIVPSFDTQMLMRI